jgi:hypothetical protein
MMRLRSGRKSDEGSSAGFKQIKQLTNEDPSELATAVDKQRTSKDCPKKVRKVRPGDLVRSRFKHNHKVSEYGGSVVTVFVEGNVTKVGHVRTDLTMTCGVR